MLHILFLILGIVLAIYVSVAVVIGIIVGVVNGREAYRWHKLSWGALLRDSLAIGFAWPGIAVLLVGYCCLGSVPDEEEG